MNQSPQIKLTSFNGKDENPKAVENQLVEAADRWDPPGLPDLGECQVGPLWWLIFSCSLESSLLGSRVEYGF
jgi:hypothetical protein